MDISGSRSKIPFSSGLMEGMREMFSRDGTASKAMLDGAIMYSMWGIALGETSAKDKCLYWGFTAYFGRCIVSTGTWMNAESEREVEEEESPEGELSVSLPMVGCYAIQFTCDRFY